MTHRQVQVAALGLHFHERQMYGATISRHDVLWAGEQTFGPALVTRSGLVSDVAISRFVNDVRRAAGAYVIEQFNVQLNA